MEEIDIKQIAQTIWERKILVIVITLITTLVGGIYSYVLQEPEYQSTTTLVLAKSENAEKGSSALTTTDVTINQKLVGTYSEIIKSKSVLSKVIDNLGMNNLSQKSLKSNITVKSVKDTEVISITVSDKNANNAAEIANEIGKVFSDKVAEIYKLNNVYTLDVAEPAISPYNIKHTQYLAISFIIGIIISCGYIAIRELFDTTIKRADQIEELLNVPVIAQISDITVQIKGGIR